jgi:hypothetical protein
MYVNWISHKKAEAAEQALQSRIGSKVTGYVVHGFKHVLP